MSQLAERLAQEFADKEYAHAYMDEHRVSRIAAQVFALRKQRGWSQKELATRAGIAQERVSKIESADFDSLTMKTLAKFADAFDVNLRIAFEAFSEGILDVVNLRSHLLEVPARENDLRAFTRCERRVNRNGEWTTVDPSSLQLVTPLAPPNVKRPPSEEWQDIAEVIYG